MEDYFEEEWMEVSEKEARLRNLRISIAKGIIAYQYDLEQVYRMEQIVKEFCFCKRDVKYYLEEFFDEQDERYVLNTDSCKLIGNIIKAHEQALPYLEEAQIVYLKTFGRFYDEYEKGNGLNLNHKELQSIYKQLKNVITVLHWGRLPIFNKYLMMNSGKIPEDGVLDFYNHYHMLKAMLRDIRGEGEKMETKGDDTLEKDMTFSVYTRRWGHTDSYRIRRTVDGWNIRHIAINGECDRDGTGGLFMNLNHDAVFYPEEGIKHAMSLLWEQADEGELTLEELQKRLQEVADWISIVEKAVGEGQPEWVAYY